MVHQIKKKRMKPRGHCSWTSTNLYAKQLVTFYRYGNVPEVRNMQRLPNTLSSQTYGGPIVPTTTVGGGISNNNGNGHIAILPNHI